MTKLLSTSCKSLIVLRIIEPIISCPVLSCAVIPYNRVYTVTVSLEVSTPPSLIVPPPSTSHIEISIHSPFELAMYTSTPPDSPFKTIAVEPNVERYIGIFNKSAAVSQTCS